MSDFDPFRTLYFSLYAGPAERSNFVISSSIALNSAFNS